MDIFEISQLYSEHEKLGKKLYYEFLRVPSLSVGLYVLLADGIDPQEPHTEDEVYYVAKGRGKIRVGDEDHDVQAGSVIYVPAHVEHRFHTIMEDMTILVFFAPAEYSMQPQDGKAKVTLPNGTA